MIGPVDRTIARKVGAQSIQKVAQGDLLYQGSNGSAQFVRSKAERPRLGLVGDASMSADQVKTIQPTGVGLFGRGPELVNDRGNLDAKFSYARTRHHRAFLFIFRASENNLVFNMLCICHTSLGCASMM